MECARGQSAGIRSWLDTDHAATPGQQALTIDTETGSARILTELAQLDDTGPDRLLLSNAADFDRVDAVRAESDAILIGAATLRADNPRLLVNSAERRAHRVSRGLPEYPLKVTLTASGNLDPEAKFWHHGDRKLVYTTDAGAIKLREQLGELADIVALGTDIDFGRLLDDLGERGVARLMVEGGGHIHTALLSHGLADEIQLAIAPTLVGATQAPKFLHPAPYPGSPTRRMTLVETRTIGDVALLRYLPKGGQHSMSTTAATPQDHAWMKRAIALSRQCPPSDSAYSVGAVLVDQHGAELSRGYSRETDPKVHAEEAKADNAHLRFCGSRSGSSSGGPKRQQDIPGSPKTPGQLRLHSHSPPDCARSPHSGQR
ncbi:dihydrofolate reductase family protein [Haloactinomyces albus]|uniref:dihydrofolate reductase family protein n=1 Tax=Haloactinomyces albus TaxID=1352928 RepID=UPI002869EDCC|nr:dihydrofolate reductase family protein [Haloactinomyces albus]